MAYEFPFFRVELEEPIAIVYLNKPEKRNAMDWSFWNDLPLLIEEINQDSKIRCFIIAAEGKSFSVGLDLEEFFTKFSNILHGELADSREQLLNLILKMQKGINAIQESPKPSIAAVHKHCIGGGLDLIAACDIRYACEDAVVSLREVRVGIVADMGSLNRLPYIIGEGNTRELALTGKDITAKEGLSMGLFSKVFPTKQDLIQASKELALEIANNPAIVIRGIKKVMNYSQGKSLKDGLEYVAAYNAGLLDSYDLREAFKAFQSKRKPIFNQKNS